MEVQVKRTIDYIPKWNKNQKDKNPIVFHLRYLSTGELQDCIKSKPSTYDAETKKVTGGEIIQDDKKWFNLGIMEIDNLEVNDGTNKTPITTGRELLLQPGLDNLYYEVLAYIKRMNARIDPKNS